MADAIDSKKLLSKKYRTWRVLQAPGAWAQCYIDRGKQIAQYQGAIIFPEQLIPLGESAVYVCNFDRSSGRNSLSFSIVRLENPELVVFQNTQPVKLTSVQEVYDFEERNSDRADLTMLKISGKGNGDSFSRNQDFNKGMLFSNKRSAKNWMVHLLNSTVS